APVEADRNGLSLVLTRLLSNAVKFSPHGGNIRVRVENDGKQARLSVEDEGVGIPPDRRERLFERFYRAHAGTAYDVGGMGLGLHLSREFIARHGGRLWYSSRDDRGSVFTFTLPLAS